MTWKRLRLPQILKRTGKIYHRENPPVVDLTKVCPSLAGTSPPPSALTPRFPHSKTVSGSSMTRSEAAMVWPPVTSYRVRSYFRYAGFWLVNCCSKLISYWSRRLLWQWCSSQDWVQSIVTRVGHVCLASLQSRVPGAAVLSTAAHAADQSLSQDGINMNVVRALPIPGVESTMRFSEDRRK